MDLVIHYNRQYRIPFDRSISEHRLPDHNFPSDFSTTKGHRDYQLRKETINSYHQDSHNNSSDIDIGDKAKDLRINQKSNSAYEAVSGIRNDVKIKSELQLLQRRYFCIFCKMDFVIAEDFIEHLEELHPNGSFVLVKRDQPFESVVSSPSSPPPPPQTHHRHHHQPQSDDNENLLKNDTNPPPPPPPQQILLPETIQNRIKIEPISEDEDDEEEEEMEYRFAEPVLSTNNNKVQSCNNTILESSTNDPNHQLMVLNNSSRIGDGPGEYLCNVCNAKFVYKNNLKSHLKRHLGIYPYVCFYPSCGKRYQFKCKLNKHIEQAHQKIKHFQCPVPSCPKKYFTRNDLAFHISVTHQERQEIPCHICKKVFNSQKSLQIHCRKYHRNIVQES